MKRIYEFVCVSGHHTEKLTDYETDEVRCSSCGVTANRIVSAPSVNLEGWSGHFPSSWMKFDKKHRDKLKQEQKRELVSRNAEFNVLEPITAGKRKNMLIDKEDESPSELDIVEEQKQLPEAPTIAELPEKYREKSLEEVIRMHQEAEKLIGKQAQEVGEVRKLADELIKQNLSSNKQPIEQVEPEVDFFENPKEAIRKTVDSHPDVVAGRQAALDFKKMQIQQKLAQEHPDFGQIAQDTDFQNWVKSSPVRLGLYAKADGEFDYDSANELLSTYKQLKGIKAKQTSDAGETQRKTNLKAAAVDVGGTGESSKRVYRRADLIRLKMTDPNRYEALSEEIMQAYSEGRVK